MSSASYKTSHPLADSPSSPGSLAGEPRRSRDEPSSEESAIGNSSKPGAEQPVRPKIPRVKDLYDVNRERCQLHTRDSKEKAWSEAAKTVEQHSKMVEQWKNEIGTYIVFAGLFSSILTTFNVQAYTLLNPPPPDASLAVLKEISSQLASFSIHPPFVNSTQQPTPLSSTEGNPPSPVPQWAVWLNGLWFIGLISSLAAGTVGIAAMQWLNEYANGDEATSRSAVRLRQYRLKNFQTWCVEDIVDTIPALLQLSLGFFLSGLLVLLWNLRHTIATLSSVFVALLGLFITVTTLLPLFRTGCAYVTPQARALRSMWQPKRLTYLLYTTPSHAISRLAAVFNRFPYLLYWCLHSDIWRFSSSAFTAQARIFLARLQWTTYRYLRLPNQWKEHKPSWQGREQAIIGHFASELDRQILLEAYNSTLRPDALTSAAIFLTDLDAVDVVHCFRMISRIALEHFGQASTTRDNPMYQENHQMLLWLQVMTCLLVEDDYAQDLSEEEAAVLVNYARNGCWSPGMEKTEAQWAMAAINATLTHSLMFADDMRPFLNDMKLADERMLLLRSVGLTEPLMDALYVQAITGAYGQARLAEKLRTSANVKAVLSTQLEYTNHFLKCVDLAKLKVRTPSDNLQDACAYTGDVLAHMTRVLLEQFTGEQVQHIRTAVNVETLLDLMCTLAEGVSEGVLHYINEELVPEVLRMTDTLARPYDYAIPALGMRIPGYASALEEKVIRLTCGRGAGPVVALSISQAVTRAYCRIHLTESPLVPDDPKADLTMRLECINHFLTRARLALRFPLSPNNDSEDQETVRAYTRNVVAHLTRILLERFAGEQVQHIRTAIDACTLGAVMTTLAKNASDEMLQCIDDELLPDVYRMLDTLAKPYNYDNDDCGQRISDFARALKERVICLRGYPGEG